LVSEEMLLFGTTHRDLAGSNTRTGVQNAKKSVATAGIAGMPFPVADPERSSRPTAIPLDNGKLGLLDA